MKRTGAGGDWADAEHPVQASDGRTGNPPVQDFFAAFTDKALGQLLLWLDLQGYKKSASVGDYVFLQEIVVAEDGDPITFSSISQDYRHLVVELIGSTYDAGQAENSLLVSWSPFATGAYGSAGLAMFDGVEYPIDSTELTDDQAVIPFVIPDQPGGSNSGKYAAVTMKFPYYSVDGVQKQLMWQSVGEDFSDSPTTTDVISSFGGAVADNSVSTYTDPITSIKLEVDNYHWEAGSRASLYGIR